MSDTVPVGPTLCVGRAGNRSDLQHPQPPAAGEERGGRELAVECRAPAAGDARAAVGARSVRREAVLLNEVAVAFHEQRAAVVTPRVLEIADAPREVAGVDIP